MPAGLTPPSAAAVHSARKVWAETFVSTAESAATIKATAQNNRIENRRTPSGDSQSRTEAEESKQEPRRGRFRRVISLRGAEISGLVMIQFVTRRTGTQPTP